MSKKDSGSKGIEHVCLNCKNFKPGKNGKPGHCGRTDKKREPDAKACSHFDPIKKKSKK